MAFFLLSIIMYPVIKSYEKGGAIDLDIFDTKYGIYSIANLGYSSVQCGSIPFNQEQLVLTCPFGNITKIVDDGIGFGVTPFSSKKSRDACLRKDEFDNIRCSEMLNQEKIHGDFNTFCQGK